MIRGTYRNKGWCAVVKRFADIGYLSLDKTDLSGTTYNKLTTKLVSGSTVKPKDAETEKSIKDAMTWLGLYEDEKIPAGIDTILDALCHIMIDKMRYAEGERDMLLMKHTFTADYPEKNERHTITSKLIDFGIKNGDSSMSRTVSLPVAITVRLVLEGKIKLTGLQIPTIPELYNPILDELETMNIKFIEKVENVCAIPSQ
mmetsp:Transcript_5981/g.6525  ORF Transcript_5981/g.6525 Transcript_5981/m.6525 type:complete len:201 (-) Transcript_5981:21-623(-)